MDPEFKRLSIQEKVDAELEIGADEFQVDDIDYDLVIVGSEVHNLPTGFASESLAKSLGNVMAEFLEYDANGHRNFMRIWVRLDIQEPLMRKKKIRKQGASGVRVAGGNKSRGPPAKQEFFSSMATGQLYDHYFNVDRIGHSDGLAFLWNSVDNVSAIGYSSNHIDLITENSDHIHWYLTGFYGFPEASRERDSRQLLRSLASHQYFP
ncbi:hypothetical protein GOBAR_DD07478 [Gossypium barbadense]|nr:hypothetical protein GOBAR_DD07478 [Gossypium barbadense]